MATKIRITPPILAAFVSVDLFKELAARTAPHYRISKETLKEKLHET
jgi:hypothetical protein